MRVTQWILTTVVVVVLACMVVVAVVAVTHRPHGRMPGVVSMSGTGDML